MTRSEITPVLTGSAAVLLLAHLQDFSMDQESSGHCDKHLPALYLLNVAGKGEKGRFECANTMEQTVSLSAPTVSALVGCLHPKMIGALPLRTLPKYHRGTCSLISTCRSMRYYGETPPSVQRTVYVFA